MGHTCSASTVTELDLHIDKFHKSQSRPSFQHDRTPSKGETYFTEDRHEGSRSKKLRNPEKEYETSSYDSKMDERPIIRISKLLEPIAVQRQKTDYLERVEADTYITADTQRRYDHNSVKYTAKPAHVAPQESKVATVYNNFIIQKEEMPVQYEREDVDILELLVAKHSNLSVSRSSGPALRVTKQNNNNEVVEA